MRRIDQRQIRYGRQCCEIAVSSHQRRPGPDRDGGDQTVVGRADGQSFGPGAPVQRGRVVPIRKPEERQSRSSEEEGVQGRGLFG